MLKQHNFVYDFAGIGIGPFNLGLAALSHPIAKLNGIFFDSNPEFCWHPGLLIDYTTLQVPFLADLVTMADPCSRFSFLNYLKESGRIYKFYIKENFFILRKEYNHYCKWVASQLPECKFGREVISVEYLEEKKLYRIKVQNKLSAAEEIYLVRKIVLGTGTSPYLPDTIFKSKPKNVLHSGEYLKHKQDLVNKRSITIVGSGQSAAEIFYDLLQYIDTGATELNWYTRADRFFPMEYSKLTLELTSPEYVDYFYSLSGETKEKVLARQNPLYKGIAFDLINNIYDLLYEKTACGNKVNVNLMPNHKLEKVESIPNGLAELSFSHAHTQEEHKVTTHSIILATGYKYKEPGFIYPVRDRIRFDTSGRYVVGRNYSIDRSSNEIYVQNAELHTHGFVTPDLGMGAYRNSIIINELMGCEFFKVETKTAFQQFSSAEYAVPEVCLAEELMDLQ